MGGFIFLTSTHWAWTKMDDANTGTKQRNTEQGISPKSDLPRVKGKGGGSQQIVDISSECVKIC